MARIRHYRARLGSALIDLGARIIPLTTRSQGQAHHVGKHRWINWNIERS